MHYKLKLIVERITTFVTNLSHSKIQCCKLRQHVVESSSSTSYNKFLVLLLMLPLKLQLVLQQNYFEYNASDWLSQSAATRQIKIIWRTLKTA